VAQALAGGAVLCRREEVALNLDHLEQAVAGCHETLRRGCSGPKGSRPADEVLLEGPLAFVAPLSLLPAPLARLNARRGHLEWFVFNRAGLRQAVAMAGFEAEATTGLIRDTAGPGVAGTLSPSMRARHAIGVLGRSMAIRARARPSPPRR